ncbi:inactive protein RESTRICTED TEV MOVEMENT 2-like [Zingiber officinale]|uniref:inactive protein RESTRICTED TEV MOVEMENT 2-like n=1 Tax=Zingiber officinale TaxID=94328 RepID=UPI001C4B0D9E|nr:inactive protein RESTRICTED TEV MOVEMENT 2-like [Zingiber officinale]
MERSPSSVPEQRIFVDFVPLDRVVSSNEAEFFVVELPGFRKEHISIRINDFGNLKITGERPLVGNRWSRFVKEFQVPDHCNASEIKAALENGLLRIELPNFAGGNRQDRKLRRRREMMAGKVVCARGPSRERRSPLEASVSH